MAMSVDAAQAVLMYMVMPLWIAAGFADWWCHRRSGIEHNAGIKETFIHLLMLCEVGVPLLAALFLEVNALVIAFMIGAFFMHEATALWDVSYAVSRREVGPIEQHIHSFLEMLPLLAIVVVSLMRLEQFKALFGLGDEAPRFELVAKPEALPGAYLTVLLASIFVFSVCPYVNELWRDWQARRLLP